MGLEKISKSRRMIIHRKRMATVTTSRTTKPSDEDPVAWTSQDQQRKNNAATTASYSEEPMTRTEIDPTGSMSTVPTSTNPELQHQYHPHSPFSNPSWISQDMQSFQKSTLMKETERASSTSSTTTMEDEKAPDRWMIIQQQQHQQQQHHSSGLFISHPMHHHHQSMGNTPILETRKDKLLSLTFGKELSPAEVATPVATSSTDCYSERHVVSSPVFNGRWQSTEPTAIPHFSLSSTPPSQPLPPNRLVLAKGRRKRAPMDGINTLLQLLET